MFESIRSTNSKDNHLEDCKSSVRVSLPHEEKEDQPDMQVLLNQFREEVWRTALEPEDIWQGKHAIPIPQFIEAIQNAINYSFSREEADCLRTMAEDGALERLHFWELGIWQKRNTEKRGKKDSRLLCSVSQKYFTNVQEGEEGHGSMVSDGLAKSRCTKSKKKTTCEKITQKFLKSGFTSELTLDHKLESLRTDMQMNALEKKWEFIVMAGEMNKWIAEAKGPKPEFKVINEEGNFLIVRKEGDCEEVVPEVVFVKKYQAMKKKQSVKQTQSKDVSRAIFSIVEGGKPKGQTPNFSQRDKELNQSLLHIMRVRNTLEYQYRILAESAINT